MVEHAGANDLIESASKPSNIFNRQLMDLEVLQVILLLQLARVAQIGPPAGRFGLVLPYDSFVTAAMDGCGSRIFEGMGRATPCAGTTLGERVRSAPALSLPFGAPAIGLTADPPLANM